MQLLRNCLIVGLGGAAGTVSRYLLSLLPLKPQSGFPLITLGINVAGAFLIGLIIAFAVKNQSVDSSLLLLLKVGFCGGFTTFSTFSLETAELFQSGKYFIALSYIVLSVILSIAAVFGAQALVK